MSTRDEFWRQVDSARAANSAAERARAEARRSEQVRARSEVKRLIELFRDVAPELAELALEKRVRETVVVRFSLGHILLQNRTEAKSGWAIVRAYAGTSGGGKVEMHSPSKAGAFLGYDGRLYSYKSSRYVIDDALDAVDARGVYLLDPRESFRINGMSDRYRTRSDELHDSHIVLSTALPRFVQDYALYRS